MTRLVGALCGSASKVRQLVVACVVVVAVVMCVTSLFGVPVWWPVRVHPVAQLLRDAEQQHDRFRQAQPTTLDDARRVYAAKRARSPPPGYDEWFAAAKRLDACVIDGYDDMYDTLQPFWALSPRDIGRRMEQLAAVRGMGRVRVRSGKVWRHDEINSDRPGSAGEDSDARRAMQSMLEAVVSQLQADLPDFDMFVNGYDEPRVSLSHKDKAQLLKLASDGQVREQVDEPLVLRTFGGEPSLADKVRLTCPSDSLTCPTAWQDLRLACDPSSLSRQSKLSELPGSNPVVTHAHDWQFTTPLGHFLVSPRREQDTWCDQPDLQDLHAAYIHPLSFTYTRQPYPVFSNSRIGGFNDILIPAWWYWFDVTEYRDSEDPQWSTKTNKLFWRGSNTGGYSISLAYKGWLRSRAVSMLNVPSTWDSHEQVVLADDQGRAIETSVPARPLLSSHADVAFVAPDQGDEPSLASQRAEPTFRFADRVPFNDNYKTKAVLDMDGTAYSGRFLALMRSRTAVFKAGLFREAMSHSLVPWYHYVPVSVRLTELPSLLGYFFGVDSVQSFIRASGKGQITSKLGRARPHDDQLKLIGERGRRWASECGRREDMMLYTYLLALEWARILHRDE
ncbi:hypothetical protein OIV83_006281 [Microbotryomycetes sp. JL201]|nr:hypothetical protein OIV83_006281 [Microbotryomycetes sp. JL201]